MALVASGGLKIFDAKATESHSLVVGFSFLIGYFSDNAIAKLLEVAETLFGTTRAKEKHKELTAGGAEGTAPSDSPALGAGAAESRTSAAQLDEASSQ